MKKIFFLCLSVYCAIAGASAQNANRRGFFVEAAIGGSVGNTPLSGVSVENSDIIGHYAGGSVISFAFGPRFRTSTHTAFEFRIEAQSNASAIAQTVVFKAMPGIRITTGELFGNVSMFINADVGFAVADSGIPASSELDRISADGSVARWTMFNALASIGVAYEIGLGLNISTHFYGGLVWDAQFMYKQIRDFNDYENLHYGMAGLRLGYCF